MGIIKLPKESLDYFDLHKNEIFDSGALAEGQWNEEVAQWACSFTNSPNALAFNSNGSGLYTVLRLLKRYRGKKTVFLQSNTMYGVKTIANSSGLDLIGFVDCSFPYLMPSLRQVEEFIDTVDNPEESVFLITHIGGWINPDIEEIANLCSSKGVGLVEDCAHSLGATINSKHSGLFGDAGVYSLYATKAVPAGEGGVLVTKDEELYEMSKRFIMYDRFEQEIDVGVNFRMSELNALLSYSVLKETNNIIANKYEVAEKYIDACNQNDISYITPKDEVHISNLYKFILIEEKIDPEIKFNKIETRTSPVYDYCLGRDPYEIASRHICLPIWFNQDTSMTQKVIEEINSCSR
tara:strand:- start:227 stop:1279 length:1053 start_codon:yes stop_codon:yes gene_type:complete